MPPEGEEPMTMETDNGEDAGRPGTNRTGEDRVELGFRQSLAQDEEHWIGGWTSTRSERKAYSG